MYALLINLTTIDQVRAATPGKAARVIRADVGGPGIPAGFAPPYRGRVFQADES